MKNKLFAFAAALAFLAGSFAFGLQGAEAPTAEPATATNATVVALKPGEKHVLTLHENVTTGFSWAAVTDGDKIAVAVEHIGPPKTKEPVCGAPGSAKITIEALDGFKGPASVTLKYMRPWNGEAIDSRKINVVLRVE